LFIVRLQAKTYFFNFVLMILHLSSNKNINSTKILGAIFNVSALQLAICECVYSARKFTRSFHFNSWLSFQRLCHLLREIEYSVVYSPSLHYTCIGQWSQKA